MSTYPRPDLTFDSHGPTCAAWLSRPGGVERPPIIVMGHGFAAIRALRLHEYAERFAQAGYAALVFDYRGWGDSDGQPRRGLNVRAQHADWRAAIAYARTLDGVDTGRLVAWGSSFGGGHALYLAARDHSIAAVIAQVPHISGPAAAFANSPKLIAQLLLAGIRDQLGAMLGREPYRVPFYSPGRTVEKITVPTLIQIAKRDTVTPYDVAMKAAERIPKGEIRSYDCQHFEPYLEPYFDDVVADQIDFLNRHA